MIFLKFLHQVLFTNFNVDYAMNTIIESTLDTVL